jgi:uncharacterized protein YbbC (DUF1343 family)
LGVEQLSNTFFEQLLGKKNYSIGFIANQTSHITKSKTSLTFLLHKKIPVACLFAPEHGYYGIIEAEGIVADQLEKKTGIPIISLFDKKKKKIIDPTIFNGIDCLVFDLQDLGMRHYTYISVLYRVMEALVDTDIHLVVCDRPNPLGGAMEGPVVARGLESYISIAPIPLKHGMTVGELALYFNRFFLKKKVKLLVIPLKKYDRKPSQYTFLASLSPNIKSEKAIHGYSFLGLVGELKPFDVGVGTKHAFTIIALPENMIDTIGWKKIEIILLENGIKSKPIQYYNKSAKKKYEGLSIAIKDPTTIYTGKLIAQLIDLTKQYKISLTYGPYADYAFGSSVFQKGLFFSSEKQIQREVKAFYENAKPIFLYHPLPIIRNSYCNL